MTDQEHKHSTTTSAIRTASVNDSLTRRAGRINIYPERHFISISNHWRVGSYQSSASRWKRLLLPPASHQRCDLIRWRLADDGPSIDDGRHLELRCPHQLSLVLCVGLEENMSWRHRVPRCPSYRFLCWVGVDRPPLCDEAMFFFSRPSGKALWLLRGTPPGLTQTVEGYRFEEERAGERMGTRVNTGVPKTKDTRRRLRRGAISACSLKNAAKLRTRRRVLALHGGSCARTPRARERASQIAVHSTEEGPRRQREVKLVNV